MSESWHLGSYAQLVPLRQSTYLTNNTYTESGLEPMAIIFSLPWALLMGAYIAYYFPGPFPCLTLRRRVIGRVQ